MKECYEYLYAEEEEEEEDDEFFSNPLTRTYLEKEHIVTQLLKRMGEADTNVCCNVNLEGFWNEEGEATEIMFFDMLSYALNGCIIGVRFCNALEDTEIMHKLEFLSSVGKAGEEYYSDQAILIVFSTKLGDFSVYYSKKS